MYLHSIKFENYKGIKDSGEIVFNEHINILCGKNNAGKTSILDFIATFLTEKDKNNVVANLQHFPLLADKYQGVSDFIIPIEACFYMKPSDFNFQNRLHKALSAFSERNPHSAPDTDFELLLDNILRRVIDTPFYLTFSICFKPHPPNKGQYSGLVESTKFDFINNHNILISHKDKMITLQGQRTSGILSFHQDNIVNLLTFKDVNEYYMRNCFNLSAHRVSNPSEWVHARESSRINSTFSNYKETIYTAKLNRPDEFNLIERELNIIFPDLRKVEVRTKESDINVVIKPKNGDYDVSINKMGTGTEQILGLITAVLTTDNPGLFLIDEPHVFLHPEAERKLIDFLKRHPEHQYILSSHSPIMLNSVDLTAVHLVQKNEEDKLNVKNIKSSDKFEVSELITELDFKPSDFWFNDAFIWVEGETEEIIINKLLERKLPDLKQNIKVKKVPSTDEFKKKTIDRTSQIYKHLKDIPEGFNPPFLFILDREEKLDQEIADIERQLKHNNIPIHFLSRRESENYFLQADLITKVINQIRQQTKVDPDLPEPNTQEIDKQLQEILKDYADREIYLGKEPKNIDEEILLCRGNKVLNRIFQKYLNSEYRKIAYGELFVNEILENNPEVFDEIINFIQVNLK